MSRPEDTVPAWMHYDAIESRKYTSSSRIQNVQREMTRRALEILDLRTPSMILDVGSGSGISGEVVSDVQEDEGGPHIWVGMDVSKDMINTALERNVEGDQLLMNMGHGVPFRAGTFDAAISISAIQWLCTTDSSDVTAAQQLTNFFNGLYMSLKRGARAVLQFYPDTKNDLQRNMISAAAVKAGFSAGIMEDNAGTNKEKLYLVLAVGSTATSGGDITNVVAGIDGTEVVDARRKQLAKAKDVKKGSKQWIIGKKEQMERKGKVVKPSSKYTGRKRNIAF